MNELTVKTLINQIHKEQDFVNIHKILIDYHPYDVADAFKRLDEEDRKKIYKALSSTELADIFEYLDEEDAVKYLEEMNLTEGAKILNQMESDDAADVINEMSEEGLDKYYLDVLPAEDRNELDTLAKYDEDTAGSIMGTNYIELNTTMDVKDAMRKLVLEANESEVIDPLFVTSDGILKGTINLKDLIIARSPLTIDKIIDKNFIACNVNDEISTVTKKIKDYNLYAIPVLDNDKLVGVITIDDAIDEVVDEIKEDYGMMAGVTSDIDEQTSIFGHMLKRIPWLICLLALSLLISNITSQFEEVIVEVTIFAFFQSLIFDMAGNAGTQSLAVTVRSISRHEMDNGKGIRRHLGKEFLTALITSCILGVITFITSFIYMLIRNDSMYVEWLVALIIGGSLSISLLLTEMLGAVVPVFFHKIKVDPAVASGPLITTLSDTISIVVYFGLATAFMSMVVVGGNK
ncbi:MAG: magnesium transporter [Mollicutes bacterium]|nr:magnesium transporter [Mollicutes bacterium]